MHLMPLNYTQYGLNGKINVFYHKAKFYDYYYSDLPHTAYMIFVPWPGIEPVLPAVEAES